MAAQSTAALLPFPHVLYWGVGTGTGWPYVVDPDDPANIQPPLTAPLDADVINDLARAQIVTVPVTPTGDIRPDIVPAIRAADPDIKVFAYIAMQTAWCPGGGYPETVGYYRHFFEVAMRWNTDGLPYSACPTTGPGFIFIDKDGVRTWAGVDSWANVNMAHRVDNGDGTYTYDVAEAYADLIFQDVYAPRLYDGIYFDLMSTSASWIIKWRTGYDVDYEYAGYPDVGSFDAGWRDGTSSFNARLRQLLAAAGEPDYPLAGNCLRCDGQWGYLNGNMRENFPLQCGGNWYTNMFISSSSYVGYLADDDSFLRPSYTLNGTYPNDLDTVANRRWARLGVASTALGNGWSTVVNGAGYDQPRPPGRPSLHWWMDEYSVDPLTGIATGDGTHTGWLGQPKGDYYQMILANGNPQKVSGGDFEQGTGEWAFASFAPASATMAVEPQDAPQGSSAARVQVTALSTDGSGTPVAWASQWYGPMVGLSGARDLSVTFWAKASVDRTVTVAVENAPANSRSAQRVPITTEWKQYQVSLWMSSATTQRVRLYLGDALGTVWIDDLRVQQGTASVYRRDFDNGLVLVNPSESVQTVPLERPYHKILGTISPEINTGESVSSVTLAAAAVAGPEVNIGDGVFLVDVDETPPAQITDLRME